MSNTDPSSLGGGMSGDKRNPWGRGDVQLDMRRALILDEVNVCSIDGHKVAGALAMELHGGVVGQGQRRAKLMMALAPDGAAALVSEIFGVYARMGGEGAAEFERLLALRTQDMPS